MTKLRFLKSWARKRSCFGLPSSLAINSAHKMPRHLIKKYQVVSHLPMSKRRLERWSFAWQSSRLRPLLYLTWKSNADFLFCVWADQHHRPWWIKGQGTEQKNCNVLVYAHISMFPSLCVLALLSTTKWRHSNVEKNTKQANNKKNRMRKSTKQNKTKLKVIPNSCGNSVKKTMWKTITPATM